MTCMPGAETLAQAGEITYKGKATIKLGPVTAAFEGRPPHGSVWIIW